MSKASFRANAQASRRSTVAQWSVEKRAAYQTTLTAHCSELVTLLNARRICAYIPVGDEPGDRQWVDTLAEQVEALYLPLSQAQGELTWGRYTVWENLVLGRFNIPQPATSEPQLLTQKPGVDLIFLPATAAGRDGSRLGRGAGYYDRTLASLAHAVAAGTLDHAPVLAAVVYNHELFPTVPTEPHDAPVDWVVTPHELHVCGLPSA